MGLTLLVVGYVLLNAAGLRADASSIREASCGQRPLTRVGIEVLRPFAFLLGPFLFGNAEVGVGVDETGVGDEAGAVDALGLRRDADVGPHGDDAALAHDDRTRLDRRTGPGDDLHAGEGDRCLKVGPCHAS